MNEATTTLTRAVVVFTTSISCLRLFLVSTRRGPNSQRRWNRPFLQSVNAGLGLSMLPSAFRSRHPEFAPEDSRSSSLTAMIDPTRRRNGRNCPLCVDFSGRPELLFPGHATDRALCALTGDDLNPRAPRPASALEDPDFDCGWPGRVRGTSPGSFRGRTWPHL